MPRKEGLTKKEQAFCEYYALHCESATQAYLKAYGCEYTTANAQGCKMLHKPHIKEYIETLQKQAFESACISAEKVALKLAEIAFADKNDKIYTVSAQLKSLELLQKQMGLQTQKVEADVKNEININIE